MRKLIVLNAMFLLGMCTRGFSQQPEITIGAQVWAYDRVYPLLDGLFQDAASTQLQQLILDPNKANSSQLDALIQSFQVQAGFNQLSGVQNTVAAQMSVANLGYQSALAQQQESNLQQSIAAQQALTKANQDLATATESGNQAQTNVATLEVNNAQALVNGLAAEATVLKGSGTPWSPTQASGNVAAAPTSFTSGVPSTLLSSGSPGSGPSFPATKQLDNQMDLLWSRLARVVGAMTRPDSIDPNSRMYLIEFDTGTFPNRNRKGQLLETRYRLTCGEVVDLFPRVAAVNVANTKYRDNADIFGIMLSWFSFGVNAAYNREHLKMSQSLGQSSYITGYGIDQQEFGWKFGIPLGDNFVSSDTKRTFALVSLSPTCQTSTPPTLSLDQAIWEKPDGSHPIEATPTTTFEAVNQRMGPNGSRATAGTPPLGPVQSISFNRALYDPTKYSQSNPILVTISVTLTQPVDQQATVYANGILLKRARDTFGRAIPNGAGSGGLLEESTSVIQANTWMPISPHNLLITLDAGQFGSEFPAIRIISPGDDPAVQISSTMPKGVIAVVSGTPLECLTSVGNGCEIPSLAYQVPANNSVGVILWQNYCDPTPGVGCTDELVIQAPSVLGSGNSSTGSQTQAVAGSGVNPWGGDPEVYVRIPTASDPTLNQKQYRLKCNSEGSSPGGGGNLICEFWDGNISQEFSNYHAEDLRLEVIDQAHIGGALVAATVLPGDAWGPSTTPAPSLWGASNIHWYDSGNSSHWEFDVRFANVDSSSRLNMSPRPNSVSNSLPPSSCTTTRICTWKFTINPADFSNWADRIDLYFQGDPRNGLWNLLNIRSQISPHVTIMSDDFASWSGSNFTTAFDSQSSSDKKTGLLIGTTLVPIDCPVVSSCAVTDPGKMPKTAGIMYLQALSQKFPLLKSNADGTTLPITFQPTKSTGPVAPMNPTTSATNPVAGSQGITQTIVIGGTGVPQQ